MSENDIRNSEFTPQELELLTFFKTSIRHGQGQRPCTADILKYAAIQGYLANFAIPKHVPDYLERLTKPPIQHKAMSVKSIQSVVNDTWLDLYTYSLPTWQSEISELELVQNFVNKILIEETSFQIHRRPRNIPERISQNTQMDLTDSIFDRHASLIRKYALMGNSAELPILTEFYKKISKYLFNHLEIPRLYRVAYLWEENHPGQKFFPIEDQKEPSEEKKEKGCLLAIPEIIVYSAKRLLSR